MKKVYSNRVIIYFSIFGIVFYSIPVIICVFLLINSILNNQANLIIVYSVFLVFLICFLFFIAFMLNRFGYKIIYNAEERTIMREGFFRGYKYILKIEDIQDIVIAFFPRETTYYVIIDSYNTKKDGGSKKSFIRIEQNENNLEFIKQFWDKPIKSN